MQYRKDPLKENYYYHIYSRSIAKYAIFNNNHDYSRMIDILNVYRFTEFSYKYSRFKQLDISAQSIIINNLNNSPALVQIIAYCLMPTHIHLILKQTADRGISKFMSRVLNSYSRYFNTSHQRVGPLWSGRFKNVLVSNDEQLLHLTRYLHLNPTSANLAELPQDWIPSSYMEYINESNLAICDFDNLFDFTPEKYIKFVNNRKQYQKQLSLIKKLLIDHYTG